MSTEPLAAMERHLRDLGHLERTYEETIADLFEKIKSARGTPEAESMYDLRAELRLALVHLSAEIAELEALYRPSPGPPLTADHKAAVLPNW